MVKLKVKEKEKKATVIYPMYRHVSICRKLVWDIDIFRISLLLSRHLCWNCYLQIRHCVTTCMIFHICKNHCSKGRCIFERIYSNCTSTSMTNCNFQAFLLLFSEGCIYPLVEIVSSSAQFSSRENPVHRVSDTTGSKQDFRSNNGGGCNQLYTVVFYLHYI